MDRLWTDFVNSDYHDWRGEIDRRTGLGRRAGSKTFWLDGNFTLLSLHLQKMSCP